MQKELVTLFGRVHVPAAHGKGAPVAAKHVTALNAEAASLGYTLDGELMARLKALPKDDFAALRTSLLRTLGNVSGASARHAALFNKFPYETPDQWDYLLKRILGHMQTILEMRPNTAQVLECGHVIDDRMFNLADFGACPICQFQDPAAVPTENVRHEFKRITPLKILSAADDEFVRGKANALLARMSSLSGAEKDFLIAARPLGGLTRPSAVYRENLPFVYAFFADVGYVQGLLSGATDVMRIAAYLSDSKADLSLKENVRFKLKTRQKKDMLRLLESLNSLDEDLMRRRERWLRLAEKLNPGTAENRRRFPKTAAAFDRLRNAPEKIVTFNRKVERKVRAKRIDAQLLELLSARPGEFLRRLDFMLRTAGNPAPVLKALRAVAPKAPTKLLFELRKYLSHRKQPSGTRVFVPKGQATKMQIVPDGRVAIAPDLLDKAEAVLAKELAARFAQLPEMGRVYVDPGLRDIVMPFNRRGDSATSVQMVKGSRYPLTASQIVRLFVWWKGSIDVDLSILCYDAGFRLIEQISWTNLRGFQCVHSGDIQNAPDGASEFIDFDIGDLRRHGVRYVVPSAIVYRGPNFDEFPCFAGFMERDALKSGKKYEPESVAIKFTIAAKAKAHMPVIFDLEAMQVICADIASGGRFYATAAGSQKKFAASTQAVLDMPNTKPTAYDVLVAHAAARGRLVKDAAKADIAFTRESLDLEKLMALMD